MHVRSGKKVVWLFHNRNSFCPLRLKWRENHLICSKYQGYCTMYIWVYNPKPTLTAIRLTLSILHSLEVLGDFLRRQILEKTKAPDLDALTCRCIWGAGVVLEAGVGGEPCAVAAGVVADKSPRLVNVHVLGIVPPVLVKP